MALLKTSLLAGLALGALPQFADCQCEATSPEIPAPFANDPDELGTALDIDGERLVVTDPYQDFPNKGTAGAVFVLERQGGAWTTVATIEGPFSFFKLGIAVDLDGDRILASGSTASGAPTRLFERDQSGVWQATASFDGGNVFGNGLALSGTTAAFTDSGLPGPPGVRIFEQGTSGWAESAFLAPPTTNDGDFSLAMDGDRLVFGNQHDVAAVNEAGRAFVYRRVAGVWSLEATLEGANPSYQELFGQSVAIDGERVLVGAPLRVHAGYHSGGVHVFELQGGSWVQTAELTYPGNGFERHFGGGVALRGDVAAATWSRLPGTPGPAGGVVTFRLQAGTWVHTGGFDCVGGNDANPSDHMAGYQPLPSVALAEGLIALGVGQAEVEPDDQLGEFLLKADALDRVTSFCGCTAGPCGNHGGPSAGCANSTGSGARLSTCGSTRVGWDDLEIHGSSLPASKPGLLAMGSGGPPVPLGAGSLCLAGSAGVFRFPVATATPSGDIAFGPGLVAHSQGFGSTGPIAPGDTRSFQVWYRDPFGPCGATFNLTNALVVQFVP